MRKFIVSLVIAAIAVVGAASVVGATKPAPEHKVTICHATASKTNPYVQESVDVASIESYNTVAGHGKSGINAGDIIPAFTYGSFSYAGQNLGAIGFSTGAAILANGCKVPSVVVTPPGGGSGGGNGGGSNPGKGAGAPKPPTTGVGDADAS